MAQIRARTKRRIAAARKLVLDHLRAHPCADCGETDPVVLEFDHLRDKVGNVSAMVHSNELWRLVDEIEKCEVVCANCHRRRTARRANPYRYRATRSEERRVGTECVSTCRSRCSPQHSKNTKKENTRSLH